MKITGTIRFNTGRKADIDLDIEVPGLEKLLEELRRKLRIERLIECMKVAGGFRDPEASEKLIKELMSELGMNVKLQDGGCSE